jgi:hypothetical protein
MENVLEKYSDKYLRSLTDDLTTNEFFLLDEFFFGITAESSARSTEIPSNSCA